MCSGELFCMSKGVGFSQKYGKIGVSVNITGGVWYEKDV